MAEDSNSDTSKVRIEPEKKTRASRNPLTPNSIESVDSHQSGSSDASKPAPRSTTVLTEESENSSSGGDCTGDNPFLNPDVAERYREVYERARYECRGVFDPKLTWEPAEEKRLLRRIDKRVCLWAVRARHSFYIFQNFVLFCG